MPSMGIKILYSRFTTKTKIKYIVINMHNKIVNKLDYLYKKYIISTVLLEALTAMKGYSTVNVICFCF